MMTGYALIKLSALTFYERVFFPNKRSTFSIICRGTTAAVLIWYAIFIIMIIWGCGGSVWKNWGNPDARTHCPISLTSKHIGLMISDLLLDVWIISLPIYTVSTGDSILVPGNIRIQRSADLAAPPARKAKIGSHRHHASWSNVRSFLPFVCTFRC